jgi:hypothetical protein
LVAVVPEEITQSHTTSLENLAARRGSVLSWLRVVVLVPTFRGQDLVAAQVAAQDLTLSRRGLALRPKETVAG